MRPYRLGRRVINVEEGHRRSRLTEALNKVLERAPSRPGTPPARQPGRGQPGPMPPMGPGPPPGVEVPMAGDGETVDTH